MTKEFEALQANNTWFIMTLHLGQKPIGCKYVYRVKYKVNEFFEHYKSRLIVWGDTQVEGIDFDEIFSFVIKFFSMKCLIVVAVKKGWTLFQLDVNNAFLYGDLEEGDLYETSP